MSKPIGLPFLGSKKRIQKDIFNEYEVLGDFQLKQQENERYKSN